MVTTVSHQQQTSRMRSALGRMLVRYPYHAEWLSQDRWQPQPAVGTMAVTVRLGTPLFYYAPSFVDECSDGELEGVIHHELNHLVLGHPRIDPVEYPNRYALTIAEEVSVNEHVPEDLPSSPLLLKDFPELPPREDTIARYHRLAGRNDLEDLCRTLDMHGLWQVARPEQSDAPLDRMHRRLLRRLRGSGNLESSDWIYGEPGDREGVELLESLGSPPRGTKLINWSQVLSSAAGHRAERQASFTRPPRRMPDRAGVVPGTVCRPQRPPVVVAIDTSSSMKRRHFERIRAELDEIQRSADVTVIQCDREIRKTFALRGSLQTIVGRGGTDLRPPLEPHVLRRHDPRLVIYFTDGDGPVPSKVPSVPVIWCLTEGGTSPAAWGKVIELK